MYNSFAKNIYTLRKKRGITQNELATELNVSFQAVSKWENGASLPDISLLPNIANALGCSIDMLLGYAVEKKMITDYEKKYLTDNYYWGLNPSEMCYEVMKRYPPTRPLKLLDIGCGEGKDAVFFARNGYIVTAIDIAEAGLEKGRAFAEKCGVDVNFIRGDINNFHLENDFDIIFSSGTLHYVPEDIRKTIIADYKAHTNSGGMHFLNVFVEKPFIETAPDHEENDRIWLSGELMGYYSDWYVDYCNEVVFDCMSSGIPHKHCMDIIYAKKI